MCGIAGIFQFDKTERPGLAGDVRRAVESISHRGPDHRAIKEIGNCCLGHARLSIIDTSTQAHQPMSEENERFTISYNGELFNFKSLREELRSKGHQFSTDCDTEVVLKSYAEYGPACLDRFNGFFAFAIYDREKEELFLARDRMGIKPLFYARDRGAVLFGSELSAISAIKKDIALNHKALHLYFQLTYVPAPHSMIDGVEKLPPGHWLRVSESEWTMKSYYDVQPRAEKNPTQKDPVVMVRSELQRSVELRLMADVPLGSFLSGGIDSTIVSSIASKLKPGIETFSLGFPDVPYLDESRKADAIAKSIGSHHHRIMVQQSDLKAHVGPMLEGMDEPFADSSALAVFILSKYSSEHVKVVLSGDGGDELFGGYRKHTALQKSVHSNMTNLLLKTANPFLPDYGGGREKRWSDQLRKVKKYADGLQHPLSIRYWNWLEWTRADLVSEILIAPERDMDLEDSVQSMIHSSDLNSLLLADQRFLLPNDMLTKVDRMSMAHGLEVRTPFLDHQLVEKVNQLPFSMKNDGRKGKLILREAYKNEIPNWVFNAPKKGFEIPIEQWLRGELRDELKALSAKQLISEQAVFNNEALSRIIAEFLSGRNSSWAPTLWSFYVFQRWWLRHFRND